MGIARTHGIEISEVVCGEARAGMDKCAREWAAENHLPVKTFGTDYDSNRASAGYMRNEDFVHYGEALIAVTNGTRGVENLIHLARAHGIPAIVLSMRPSATDL